MKPKYIVSLYFSYVANSGGVIDFAENLTQGMLRLQPRQAVVLRPVAVAGERIRRLLRFVAEFWVALRFWRTPAVALFPNYFFIPLPGGRLKSVVVVHDLMFKHYPQYVGRAKRLLLDVSYRLARRYADGVVFISQDSQRDFEKHYGVPRLHTYIYNPIVLPEDSADSQALAPAVSQPYVIANFHFYPHKNLPRLLEVFGGLKKQWPELRLVFTGNRPPQFDALVAPLPFANDIQHLGFLPKQQVMALVRHAAFFMSMSQFEGFNMSAAEAALLGRPLVLSDIPVHRELFSECATLVPLDEPSPDFKGIVDYVRNHEAKTPSFANDVTPEAVASKYMAFMDQLLKA